MGFLEAVLFGVLQGVTEFLPVSSSGHLALSRALFGYGDVSILFDVLLHVATLLVVVFVFRKKVFDLIVSLGKLFSHEKSTDIKDAHRTILSIIIASFFTAVIGLYVSSFNPQHYPVLVFSLFILTGLILMLPRFIKPAVNNGPGVKTGIITGIAQGIGVFPGISRSGITISASLLSGLSRDKAGEYAFMISIPAILGALVLELKDGLELVEHIGILSMTAGFFAAMVSGFISLSLLLRFIRSGKLHYFSFYLIPLGIAGLIFIR